MQMQMQMLPSANRMSPRMVPKVSSLVYSENAAKDAHIAWLLTEFAAANAIIDGLCYHLTQLEGGGVSEYESVFSAIHQRRSEWIPMITMRKYSSIADVIIELGKVTSKKSMKKNINLRIEEVDKFKEEETNEFAFSNSQTEMSPELCVSEREIIAEDSEMEIVPEDSEKEIVGENSEKEIIPENSEKEITPENSETEIVPENSETDIIPENPETEIVPEISETDITLEKSDITLEKSDITPEKSETDITPEKSETEIVPEKSETEIVPENQEAEIIPENSVLPENTEAEIVPENSVLPENTEAEIVPENSVLLENRETEIIPENGNDAADDDVVDEDTAKEDSLESEITDTGSQEVKQSSLQNTEICSNHEAFEARRHQIKIRKGFMAKEPVKGHMVNVVRGLKLYEDVFTDNELSKLNDFVNELRIAGRNGELTGETFTLYNQQIKGRRREQIRFGVPVFEQIKDDSSSKSQKSDIEPIPSLLENIIEHLVQCHIIPDNRRPNSCIINFYDEDEYSQPYVKPPHLDQPISILLLSESKMAFGYSLVADSECNNAGVNLSIKEGSILVLKGNSAEVGRHVMCSSPNKRVSITLIKNRIQTERKSELVSSSSSSSPSSPNMAMSLWCSGNPNPYSMPAGAVVHGYQLNGYQPMGVIQKWGALGTPMVMLTPFRPVVMSTRRMPRDGTGVFLPWNVKSRKPAKHLPPRVQRSRLLAMSSTAETCKAESTSDPRMQEV